MGLILHQAKWSDYKRFVELCCVPSMPFPGGKCWTIEGDVGFIGYNYPYMNNRQRNIRFPSHMIKHKHFDLDWLNMNIRQLNRVMIRPEYRGRGLATRLVEQTLPMVGVPYIECLTFARLIKNILKRTGFVEYGDSLKHTCRYYLWTNSQVISGHKALIP